MRSACISCRGFPVPSPAASPVRNESKLNNFFFPHLYPAACMEGLAGPALTPARLHPAPAPVSSHREPKSCDMAGPQKFCLWGLFPVRWMSPPDHGCSVTSPCRGAGGAGHPSDLVAPSALLQPPSPGEAAPSPALLGAGGLQGLLTGSKKL